MTTYPITLRARSLAPLVKARGFGMTPEEVMDQGFGPKLSRVASGLCFFMFLAALGYFFGQWVMYAVLFLPSLLWLLLRVAVPKSYRKKRVIDLVSRSVDFGDFFMERLDDRFESLTKRLRR